jgi:hypothetical protein
MDYCLLEVVSSGIVLKVRGETLVATTESMEGIDSSSSRNANSCVGNVGNQ